MGGDRQIDYTHTPSYFVTCYYLNNMKPCVTVPTKKNDRNLLIVYVAVTTGTWVSNKYVKFQIYWIPESGLFLRTEKYWHRIHYISKLCGYKKNQKQNEEALELKRSGKSTIL